MIEVSDDDKQVNPHLSDVVFGCDFSRICVYGKGLKYGFKSYESNRNMAAGGSILCADSRNG